MQREREKGGRRAAAASPTHPTRPTLFLCRVVRTALLREEGEYTSAVCKKKDRPNVQGEEGKSTARVSAYIKKKKKRTYNKEKDNSCVVVCIDHLPNRRPPRPLKRRRESKDSGNKC